MIKYLIILLSINVLITATDKLFAQNDGIAFYRHLQEKKLFDEQLTFLVASKDTLQKDFYISEMAHVFLKLNKPDSANIYFSKLQTLPPTLAETALHTALAVKDTFGAGRIIHTFSANWNEPYRAEAIVSLAMLKEQRSPSALISQMPFTELSVLADNYNGFKPKSAALAAGMSMILPGSGKWYLGYRQQAKTSLLINLALSLVVFESFKRNAPDAMKVSSSVMCGVFYIGNIWGSAALAKKRKKDFIFQMHETIAEFYRFRATH